MGLKGLTATAIHFAAIFYTGTTIEPDFEVALPINEWCKIDLAMVALHHVIYAAAAGCVSDVINKNKAAPGEE